jgi:hypothetical protein
MPGQSFEEWVRQQFEELARISQEGGQLAPLSIDLDTLTDGDYLKFDGTSEQWTAGNDIPASPDLSGYFLLDGTRTITGDVLVEKAVPVVTAKVEDPTTNFATSSFIAHGNRTGTGGAVARFVAQNQEGVDNASASEAAIEAWYTTAGNLEFRFTFNGTEIAVLSATEATGFSSPGSKIIRNWGPTDASFPASGYATLDTRNNHPVLDFPTGGYTAAYFHGVIPDNYDGQNIDVALYVAMTSATSGAINFNVRIENLTAQDIDSNGFAGYVGTTTTVSSTSGVLVESVISLSGSALDGVAAGNPFRIEVTRHTSSRANDTATGDAELLMVEMRIA